MRSVAVVLAALAHLPPAQAHTHRQRSPAEAGETPPTTPAWASWVGAEPLLGAADSEGADVHSDSPFANSPAVAPELRPALAVATAVLRAVSQTPAALGSKPNAARLRDALAQHMRRTGDHALAPFEGRAEPGVVEAYMVAQEQAAREGRRGLGPPGGGAEEARQAAPRQERVQNSCRRPPKAFFRNQRGGICRDKL